MIKKRLEVLEMAKQIIKDWFVELKKNDKLEWYDKVFHNKKTPDFLLKYFERYEEKLRSELVLVEVSKKTWLEVSKVRIQLYNGYTISEILSLSNKKI